MPSIKTCCRGWVNEDVDLSYDIVLLGELCFHGAKFCLSLGDWSHKSLDLWSNCLTSPKTKQSASGGPPIPELCHKFAGVVTHNRSAREDTP